MRSRISFLVLLLITIAACTADSFPPEFEQKALKRIIASESSYYGPAEPALKKLLLAEKKNGTTNHFCVVGYAYSEKNINVWVHWLDEQRLLLWRDNSDEELREKGLMQARRNLKLGKDTVETQDDINGSSYLVTRAWWQAVAKDCEAHGERYTVEPFTAPLETEE